MQQSRIRKTGARMMLSMIVLCLSINSHAQFGSTDEKDNGPRSIWDKEPEPKTSDGSPFGSPVTAQQRLGSGINQQGTTTLGGPPNSGTLQGGLYGPDAGGVPIDGGLGFLLAAGAGYGVRRIRNARKRKK